MKLYYQLSKNNIPFDSFCGDAAIGATSIGIDAIGFYNVEDIPKNKNIMVVATVEDTQEYLGYKINPIDDGIFKKFFKRKEEIIDIKSINDFPCFIKPYNNIKSFTGFVAFQPLDLETMTFNYTGLVIKQEVIDFLSEYRCFIKNGNIIGIKHYTGDPLISIDSSFLNEISKFLLQMKEYSYTIDIGIDKNGVNYIIELNDGWAVANYGLDPVTYFSFLKERWFQILK